MIAEFLRRAASRNPEDTLKELHPGTPGRLVRKAASGFAKSASEAGSTTVAGWAAELVTSRTEAF